MTYIQKNFSSQIAVNKLLKSQRQEILTKLFHIANCFGILFESLFKLTTVTKRLKKVDTGTLPITNDIISTDNQEILKPNE